MRELGKASYPGGQGRLFHPWAGVTGRALRLALASPLATLPLGFLAWEKRDRTVFLSSAIHCCRQLSTLAARMRGSCSEKYEQSASHCSSRQPLLNASILENFIWRGIEKRNCQFTDQSRWKDCTPQEKMQRYFMQYFLPCVGIDVIFQRCNFICCSGCGISLVSRRNPRKRLSELASNESL